ncbi:HAMP domain-containing sensor histidine kinase [Lachnospiraceae bacterium 66-29]
MNDYKQIKSIILGRFFRKMTAAGLVCLAVLLVCLFAGKFFLSTFTWYGTEGFYPLLHWISDNQQLFVAVMFMAGLFVIGIIYWIKLLNYFQDVMKAMEELTTEEHLIHLRPELREVEQHMNQVQFQIHRSERLAKEAEQRKNDLVVYLAHDLKTPLTSVIGYLTLLREETQISPELREKYLSISLEKAERLEDLINEFFEITRFNLTHLELETVTVSLKRMLEQIIYEFYPLFSEKQIECQLLIEPEDIKITCDTDKMQRVFDNLLRNALLYGYQQSTIQIRAKQWEKSLFIQVENHGATIPQEKLARIFEQFYRLDTSRQSKTGGAGLGLAIAKEIVERHGGKISAKSQEERTIFTVELPMKIESQSS